MAPSSSGPTADASPPGAQPAPRVYIQIAQSEQRAAAGELELRLEGVKLGEQTVVVPGIELVNVRPQRSVLRCFRVDECRDDAPRLVEAVNALLITPQLTLEDLSSRYGTATNIRARHYEIWFAPGEIAVRARSGG